MGLQDTFKALSDKPAGNPRKLKDGKLTAGEIASNFT
jgi:hypothetical protein